MKHLKKLSVAIMMVTLFSGTFTSCIDNEVSPLVEAIYEAQADLIAAQAGVQNAEAALLLAEANAEQAQVAYVNAQTAQMAAVTAGIVAANSYEASRRVEILRALVASTNAQVAASQNAMAVAQAQFNATMAALTATMQAAGATLAVGYSNQFTAQMAIVNSLKATKLAKEGELALAELYLTAGSPQTTWTLYLAGLNAKLAAEQAKVTAAEAAIVTLNAAKANPSAIETQLAGLKSQKATLEARKIALVGLIVTAEQNRLAAQKAIDDATAFMSSPSGTYATAKTNLATWKTAYTADSLEVKVQTANVATYTAAIANYAGVTTTLTTAKTNAITAQTTAGTNVTNAIAALGTSLGTPTYLNSAITPANTLYKELWNAQLAYYKADNNLTVHNTALSLLDASYQAAILDLYTEQGFYDAGIGAANTALTTAQSNLLTGQATQIAAQADYNAKKAAFEANPSGYVWTAGVDGVLGIHPTAVGPHNSYIAVTSIVIGAANDVYAAVTTSLPAGNNIAAIHASNTYAEFRADGVGLVQADGITPYVLAANDYWNVGVDDVAGGTHAARLDAAVVALTAANANVVSLQSAVTAAQLYVDTFGDDLDAALAVYNTQKALYDNGVATKATLTGIRATALTAANTAQTAVTTATTALGVLITPAAVAGNTAISPANTLYKVKWNADLAVANTTLALSTHLATNVATYQTWLATAQAALTVATREAAEDLIYIAKYTADLAALQTQYNALILTPLFAALNVTLVNATQAKAALVAEDAAATISISSLTTMITALQVTVPNYTNLIAAQNLIITNAKAEILATQIAISQGGVTLAGLQANVQLLKAQIAALTIEIANAQAIADKYKALMLAALAS